MRLTSSPLRVASRKSNSNILGMPKSDQFWTCSVCGQVVVNEPQPVLSHHLTHVAGPTPRRSSPVPKLIETRTGTRQTEPHIAG